MLNPWVKFGKGLYHSGTSLCFKYSGVGIKDNGGPLPGPDLLIDLEYQGLGHSLQ